MMRTLVLLFAVCFSGCAAPSFTQTPQGTYKHSAQGNPTQLSGEAVKVGLVEDANAFCAKTGKKYAPVRESARDASGYLDASAEIEFRCQ